MQWLACGITHIFWSWDPGIWIISTNWLLDSFPWIREVVKWRIQFGMWELYVNMVSCKYSHASLYVISSHLFIICLSFFRMYLAILVLEFQSVALFANFRSRKKIIGSGFIIFHPQSTLSVPVTCSIPVGMRLYILLIKQKPDFARITIRNPVYFVQDQHITVAVPGWWAHWVKSWLCKSTWQNSLWLQWLQDFPH